MKKLNQRMTKNQRVTIWANYSMQMLVFNKDLIIR